MLIILSGMHAVIYDDGSLQGRIGTNGVMGPAEMLSIMDEATETLRKSKQKIDGPKFLPMFWGQGKEDTAYTNIFPKKLADIPQDDFITREQYEANLGAM